MKTDVKQQDDARKRLLDAAVDLFTEKGYAATSVSEIVQAASVTKPMLYYYFNSKEGIYVEIMSSVFNDFKELINRYKYITTDVYRNICDLFIDILKLHEHSIKKTKLIYAMIFGPPQGAPDVDVEEYHSVMTDVVSRMIKSGVDNGELENVDVNDLTTVVLSVLFFCLDSRVIECSCRMADDDLLRIVKNIFDKIIIKRGS